MKQIFKPFLLYALLTISLGVHGNDTVPGNALHFDGSNDFIQVNKTVIPSSGDFTIEVWINADPDITGYREILSQDAGTEGANFYIGMASGSNIIRVGDGWTNSNVPFPLDGKWHQLVVSKSDANTKLYLDGGLVATTTSINNPKGSIFRIGRQFGIHSEYFKGKIDELRIWNTVRTAEEIRTSKDTCLTGLENSLVAYYNFNTGTADSTNTDSTSLRDLTENGNKGTLTNFALTGTTSNWVESYAMVVPKKIATIEVTPTSFTANWEAPLVGTVDNYLIDVSTDSTFSSFVAGYEGYSVNGNLTSTDITGLTTLTTYFCRVQANKTSVEGEGAYSTISKIDIGTPNAPLLNVRSSFSFNENSAGVTIDSAATIVYEGENTNWTNGNLTLQITNNAENTDQLRIDTSGVLAIESTTILYNDTTIASLNVTGGITSGGEALIVTFNDSANTARVQCVLQSFTIQNISSNPKTSKTIRVSASDYYTSTDSVTCVAAIIPYNESPYVVVNNPIWYYREKADTVIINNAILKYIDNDNNTILVYTITQLPTQGILSLSGTELALNNTFTQSDIDLEMLLYTHTGTEFPIGDSCVFSLSDGAHTLTGITLNIAVKKAFTDGVGTKENPYQIASKVQLDKMRLFSGSYFIQTADISFDDADFVSGGQFYNNGAGWNPIGSEALPFKGNFSGAGHTVTNLFINRSTTTNVGFFGFTDGATIDSMGLVNCNITGYQYVGGMVGFCSSSTITNSYSIGAVKGNNSIGGLVGYKYKSTESHCYTTGSVTGSTHNIGGLVGFNFTNSIVSYCYSTASVSGSKTVGGLVGSNFYNNSKVLNCYSTGLVKSNGSDVGGLVGSNFMGIVQNSYYDSETSGKNDTGKGFPKTTAEMKQLETFSSWNFENTWGIRTDSIYPALNSVNNAPFAFTKSDTVGSSLSFSRLISNDYDYETLQTSTVCMITDKGLCSVKGKAVYLPSSVTVGNVYTIYYRIGEVRTAQNDTLWGNSAKSTIVATTNTAPQWIEDINSYSIEEDKALDLLLTTVAKDDEGDALSYRILSAAKNGSQTIIDDSLQYLPNNNFYGTDSIQVEVDDGFISDTTWFFIQITAVNDQPIITSTAQVMATEDLEYSYTITASDVENSTLTYSLGNAPVGMQITGSEIAWIPTEGVLTSGEVSLFVSDGELSATEIFTIAVSPVNDAPFITSKASVTATEDLEYIYAIVAVDAEDSTLTYSLGNAPVGMKITGSEIAWIPTEGVFTSDEVILTVSDGELSDTELFTITVAAVNDVPEVKDTTVTVKENTSIEVELTATDIEGSIASYKVSRFPENGSVTLLGTTLTYTPKKDYIGMDSLCWIALDDVAASSKEAVLKIIVTGENGTSINAFEGIDNILLYPNPVADAFVLSGFEGLASLRLIDIRGKVLLQKDVASQESISVSMLPQGMYTVNLTSTRGTVQFKLVKQ